MLDVLDNLISEIGGFDVIEQIMYVGDGGGDFCPCMRLRECDVVCCRKGWALHKKLECVPDVKAALHSWQNGADVLSAVHRIFDEGT